MKRMNSNATGCGRENSLFLVAAVEQNNEHNEEQDHDNEGQHHPDESTWFTGPSSIYIIVTDGQLNKGVSDMGAGALEI